MYMYLPINVLLRRKLWQYLEPHAFLKFETCITLIVKFTHMQSSNASMFCVLLVQ